MLGVAARRMPAGDREGMGELGRLLLRPWKGEERNREAKAWEGEALGLLVKKALIVVSVRLSQHVQDFVLLVQRSFAM